MSTTYRTYVGPYARVAAERVEKEGRRTSCQNAECKNHTHHMRSGFCPLCGSSVGPVTFTELAFAIDAWDVREEIEDALSTPGGDAYIEWSEANSAHLWVPNTRGLTRDGQLEEREPFSFTDIQHGQIAREIEEFERVYRDVIDQLSERYGAIVISWGIIQDYL